MIHEETQGAVHVFTLEVALNQENAPKLYDAIAGKNFSGQPMVVLNMAHVPMLDSAGLESLLDIQQKLREFSGSFKIAGLTQLCQDVLRVTGLTDHFEIFADNKTAVGSFVR